MKNTVRIVASLVLALSCAGTASAQIFATTNFQQPSAFGQEPVIRVTATFRSTLATVDGQSIPDTKAQETARREIYTMAANECAVLSETFKAECRLAGVTIFAPSGQPSASPPGTINGNANYELRMSSRASGQ
jgi:hypothetical protein